MPRLPRKNDPKSILARQQALGLPEVDVEPWVKAAESVTGLVSIPVSVAQLAISLGEYELSEDGEVVETGTAETGMTATPTSDSAASANAARSTDVTIPSPIPIASRRRAIEPASFFRGQRTERA